MKLILLIIVVLGIITLTRSQDQEIFCSSNQSESELDSSNRGGKFLTADGELKVLVVFAKFKADNSPHPYWPIDSYPDEMSDFIDSDIQTRSTHFINLTNYYKQMSFGKFTVIGKSIGMETPYPASHYITGINRYPNRTNANKDILQLVDDSINYGEFDNWTYLSDYNHLNQPDDVTDMIVVIWRGLVFCESWTGESSLGGGQELWVENHQKKIRLGCGGNANYGIFGSGVTIQYWGERSRERNFKTVIHEIAHWLIQPGHPYKFVKHTFWGMLTLAREGICANSFEREKLNWFDATLIEETNLFAQLSDYVTTPSAYKYYPSNSDSGEVYYFENHQQLSVYDDGIANSDDKGIFILHLQNGSYLGDCLRLLTSSGFWIWNSPYNINCWDNSLPSFKQKSVNRKGFGNRDKITSDNSVCEFLYSYINDNNEVECNDWLHGYGMNNAFDTTYNDVFSPFSNPPANTWSGQSTALSMEVVSESGNIINAKFILYNTIEVKPSKPAIGLDPPKVNQQYKNGWIYIAWGADVWDDLPIESDIDFSELQIKINSGVWNTIYTGVQRYWSDSSYNFDSTGNMQAQLRVRIRDTNMQWSIWSNTINAKIQSKMISSVDSNAINLNNFTTKEFLLFQNYPNPFNSSTKISWQSPIEGWHSIKMYDLLGNEIAVLLNEYKQAGRYSILFSKKDIQNFQLSSGIYFYQLIIQSENDNTPYYKSSRKLIILK